MIAWDGFTLRVGGANEKASYPVRCEPDNSSVEQSGIQHWLPITYLRRVYVNLC